MEWPNPEKSKKSTAPPVRKTLPQQKKSGPLKKVLAREPSAESEGDEWSPGEFGDTQFNTPSGDGEQKLTPALDLDGTPGPENDDLMDVDESVKDAISAKADPPEKFSRDEEIEKLRVGGSMTQNQTEISRIRNISKVQFGKFNLSPWYFSPYPESFINEDLMYICEFCLCYYGDFKSFTRHRQKCTLLHPPGNEIYRDHYVSFFEIDGKRQRTWCRNLCLLSKMFLDHKTLYYDVDPFLFYVMTTRDEKGHHLIGYFSKEKESQDGYNVACILTLPQFQRKGYGRLLIQFSYELSKIEAKLGSPEKPLSDLGLLSYRQYWTENILEILIDLNQKGEKVSIELLSNELAMTPLDVESTLVATKMQQYSKGEHKVIIPMHLINKHQALKEKYKTKPKRVIEPERINWKPPVFTASNRTWGW